MPEHRLNSDAACPRMTISTRAAAALLAWTTAVVALLCIAATVCRVAFGIEHGPLNIIPLLNLYQESTLPSWFSSILLFLCALLLGAIGWIKSHRREPFTRHWLGLAGIFVLLSMDEAISLHERLSWPMRRFITAQGVYLYAWVIPASLFLLVLSAIYLRFVLHLPRRTRSMIVLAAAVYVGAALGMEMAEGVYHTRHGDQTPAYATMVAIEEICEMIGIALFLHALLTYAQHQWAQGVSIVLRTETSAAPAMVPDRFDSRQGPPGRAVNKSNPSRAQVA